jgi:hypothetical protein
MRGVIADLRYGVAELLRAPRTGSSGAAWLLGGLLLGLGLARWVDAPLARASSPALVQSTAVARVPASLLGSQAENRLRCLARHPKCDAAERSPCSVPPPGRLES